MRQTFFVRCPKIRAIGHFRHVLERVFVQIRVNRHAPLAEKRVMHGHERLPFRACANRVNALPHGLRQIRGGERVNLAFVVHAVGQQNHDFAFRVAAAQAVHAVGNRHADGRAVFLQHADMHLLEQRQQDLIIKRQRGLRDAMPGKNH